MDICHYCNKEVINPVYESYTRSICNFRNKIKFAFHQKCVKRALKEQAVWWENLDANCNDCKNFKHQRSLNKLPNHNKEQYGDRLFPPIGGKGREGICKKYKVIRLVTPQTFQGMGCFIHR
jgi:hypothetical protein